LANSRGGMIGSAARRSCQTVSANMTSATTVDP
jgi:hypothetical protein